MPVCLSACCCCPDVVSRYIGSSSNRVISGTTSSSSKGYRLALQPPSCVFCESITAIPLRSLKYHPDHDVLFTHPSPSLLPLILSQLSYGSFYILPLEQPPHVGNKHCHGGNGSSTGVYAHTTPIAMAAAHSGAAALAAAAAFAMPVTIPPCVVVAPAPGHRRYQNPLP